jgi:hypothetical protein
MEACNRSLQYRKELCGGCLEILWLKADPLGRRYRDPIPNATLYFFTIKAKSGVRCHIFSFRFCPQIRHKNYPPMPSSALPPATQKKQREKRGKRTAAPTHARTSCPVTTRIASYREKRKPSSFRRRRRCRLRRRPQARCPQKAMPSHPRMGRVDGGNSRRIIDKETRQAAVVRPYGGRWPLIGRLGTSATASRGS